MTPDLYVIGGGPAGLAAAIVARKRGLRVTVADSRRPPIDKACGEGLMPDTVMAARENGLALPERRFHFPGVRFHGEGVAVESAFPGVPGAGIRRTELHGALSAQAEAAGVQLQWNTCVTGLRDIRSRWILGADGASSLVRGWAGLNATWTDSRRFGYRIHFACPPWTDLLEIYWGEGFQLYVTPVAEDEVSIALISRDAKLRVREAIARIPGLSRHIQGVPHASAERGAVTSSRQLRRVTRGQIALLGDASGSVDAISGDGLGLSFRQAGALASALEAEDLGLYETAHRRIQFRPRFMAEFMLTMDRWSWLRRRALPTMAKQPAIFGGLLAMHVGEAGWGEFAVNCLRLGRKMITA